MPAHTLSERGRLDGILYDAARNWLADALDREGFAQSELICLKGVHSRVRLRLNSSDDRLAVAWANSLARSIRVAVDAGSEDVVRYSSKAHALMDLVECAIAGRWERSWAWRELGFPVDSSSALSTDALLGALLSEPQLIVPVLVPIAGRHRDGGLWRVLPPVSWPQLALAAWRAAGGTNDPVTAFDRGTASAALTSESVNAEDRYSRQVERISRNSVLLQAMRQVEASRVETTELAVATLSVLEIEPAIVNSFDEGRRTIQSIAFGSDEVTDSVQSVSEPNSTTEHLPQAAKGSLSHAGKGKKSEVPYREAVRVRGESRFGGLLYLLRLIDEMDAVTALWNLFPSRSLTWVLHQLATRIVPADDTDAAVLAFAGLGPESPSPRRDEPPATEHEQIQLSAWIQKITEALEERLPRVGDRGAVLLWFVCHRQCTIYADPGWLEVQMLLSEVSTDIRRARLDLDPGFIPWLGITVVFRYE